MLWNILGAAAFALAVLMLVWALRGLLLLPVRPGAGAEISVRITVRGDGAALENTVAALEWLRGNGTLPCSIEADVSAAGGQAREEAFALERAGRITVVNEGE